MSDKDNQPTVESPDSEKLVSSVLYTQGTKEINEKVAKELKVPDPTGEAATAALDKFEKANRKK